MGFSLYVTNIVCKTHNMNHTLVYIQQNVFITNKLTCVLLICTESKLNRLKGVNSKKDPVAKDMISSLDKVRLCHMRMLTDVDLSSPYIRNSDYVDESISSPTIVDMLKRKIAPERQALNLEELKNLVDNDELHLTAAMLEQTIAQPTNSAWPDESAETVAPVNNGNV